MRSFKSFSELLQKESRIEKVLANYEKYHAHTHANRDFEKLHEHVHLVMEYAVKLIEIHGLNTVIDSLIEELIKGCSEIEKVETVGSFVKRLFVNALVYHDYGKVNENFQIEKMQDKEFFKRNEGNGIGSQHSILSVFIFLNKHLNQVVEHKAISIKEQNFLIAASILFANPILKHHASFIENHAAFEKEVIDNLKPYLDLFGDSLSSSSVYLMETLQDTLEKIIKDYNINFFPFYALLKLNFSLLTAADYYATNEFMGDMPVNNFGIINRNLKKQLFENFINNEEATYNGNLYREFDFYNSLKFEDLQNRNKDNLNLLRQKMAAEAITTLRRNINQRLFYLEAPTGGGKTNMSFACALELLKSDEQLNKVFYVFPFTTLITQTFKSIKKTLKINNDQVIQLHSKGGFHTSQGEEKQDGLYGDKKLNYINNLFINYPFTLLSHIKFFNILKGNSKDTNYILHRMSNSIVIIDELQTYTPKHWDKIIFFLHQYAKHFNIRFILMSATLPKIDQLSIEAQGKVTPLVPNKPRYFTNPNFKDRVTFDFSLLGKSGRETIKLEDLATKVYQELELYATNNGNSANGLIEFIIKKSASKFFQTIKNDTRFSDYQKFLISGTILEPRRREIIDAIGNKKYEGKPFKKSIIVTTQVVEAGVDIDMDIGFKDRSLVDSDEQLAGRVNRNASKSSCKVFIFNYDREVKIYGKDKRYEQKLPFPQYKKILANKNFDILYNAVNQDINKLNKSEHFVNIKDYLNHFKRFQFRKINDEFKLIDTQTTSLFVPLEIDRQWFTNEELIFLYAFDNQNNNTVVSGKKVFDIYRRVIAAESDFIKKMIDKKQIGGIMSKFMFSIFTNSKLESELLPFYDKEIFDQFGIIYLSGYQDIYSYEGGINEEELKNIDHQFL